MKTFKESADVPITKNEGWRKSLYQKSFPLHAEIQQNHR